MVSSWVSFDLCLLSNFFSSSAQLCQKGIKVTVIYPGPIDTSKVSGATEAGKSGILEVNL